MPHISNRPTADLGSPSLPAGIHMIIMRVYYTDAFGHPVSVLHTAQVFTADVDPSAPFNADLTWTVIRDSGSVKLTLTETRGARQDVSCRLILPAELQCTEPKVTLQLEPNGSASHAFLVRNTTALRGSGYRIYAILDFIRDRKHLSMQKSALLTIDPYRIMSPGEHRCWIALAVVLLLMFCAAQMRSRRSA